MSISLLASCGIDSSKINCDENWALCSINHNSYEENSDSDPIKIAIIDSGIDNDKTNVNLIARYDEDMNDVNGHGTAVASIIAHRNGFLDDFQGVISNAAIYDINVLNKDGKANVDEIVKGIHWAVKKDVDIINMSFGIEKDDPDLRDSINQALKKNIVIIAAAGNKMGLGTDYPAKYDGVFSISSVDQNYKIDPFAAKGKIDFVGPGVNVKAIQTRELANQNDLSGTSFATAYITGIVALLLKNGEVHRESLENDLMNYVIPLGDSEYYGNGFLKLNNK